MEENLPTPSEDKICGVDAQIKTESTSNSEEMIQISSSSERKSLSFNNQEDLLKDEISNMREENKRLKVTLTRIINDYQSLQSHFSTVSQEEDAKSAVETIPSSDEEEYEFLSLSLGTSSSRQIYRKEDKNIENTADKDKGRRENLEEDLTLRLDCKLYDACSSGLIKQQPIARKEDASTACKMVKDLRNNGSEALQQPQVKKTRVCVRTRCNGPMMNDGCQWRKFGQKIAKGNPCPRGYYRCTVAPGCPARKKVQRCAEDTTTLITTYEGNHNHPLPVSATAMASTTSTAACMLLSGSSTTTQHATALTDHANKSTASLMTSSAYPHGLNFGVSYMSKQGPPCLPNYTLPSIATNPTITLDLTATHSRVNQFSLISSKFATRPRYSSPSIFSFSSPKSNTTATPAWSSWCYSYGSQPSKEGPFLSSNHSRLSQESFCQHYLQKTTDPKGPSNQNKLTDAIAKAKDPRFQFALTATVPSYVGSNIEAKSVGFQSRGRDQGHDPQQLDSFPYFTTMGRGNSYSWSYLDI